MPRATNNPAAKQRRKRALKRTKGFFGAKKGQVREGRHAAAAVELQEIATDGDVPVVPGV